MARRRTPAQLAAALDRVVTKPAGADGEQDQGEKLAGAGQHGRVDVDQAPAGPRRARRVVVRVPHGLKQRLERHARRTGRTYTAIVLAAYTDHHGELRPVDMEPAGTGELPPRDFTAVGRRRGIHAVDLPLSLYPGERAVLERAVADGDAHTLSDLVTRLLELALPAPPRRR
jgi:hypothetical protein